MEAYCDKCGSSMKVEERRRTIYENGEEIHFYFIDCKRCGAVYPIYWKNAKIYELEAKERRLIKKLQAPKIDTLKTLEQIKSNRMQIEVKMEKLRELYS